MEFTVLEALKAGSTLPKETKDLMSRAMPMTKEVALSPVSPVGEALEFPKFP